MFAKSVILLQAMLVHQLCAFPQAPSTRVGSTNPQVDSKFFSLPPCESVQQFGTGVAYQAAVQLTANAVQNTFQNAFSGFSGFFGRRRKRSLPEGVEVRVIRSADPQGRRVQTRLFCRK